MGEVTGNDMKTQTRWGPLEWTQIAQNKLIRPTDEIAKSAKRVELCEGDRV